jgi:hypothetical protein
MAKRGDWLDRLFDLHILWLSSTFEGERQACHQKIIKLLSKHGKTIHDVPELLAIVSKRRAPPSPRPAPPAPPPGDPITGEDLFKGMHAVLRDYLTLEEHEYVACALWSMHAHVFSRFMHTPRLIARSPVRDCGKTTTLNVISQFVPYPEISDNMTVAVFFRATDGGGTILLDEVDNLGLLTNGTFRAALNGGYDRGKTTSRVVKGEKRLFKLFCPVLLAGIGRVPLPLARRSITIRLERDPNAARTRERFNSEDPEQIENFTLIKSYLASWGARVDLDLDPLMPEQLTSGQCDVWRPLVSIADACSPEVGQLAREIAVSMCRDLDEDLPVILLHDIRGIFDRQRVDRLASAVIVENLNLLPHGMWIDWRGLQDNDTPHPITAGVVAKLLAPFGIRPATIWPLHRTADTKSTRGYHRHQFERAWSQYCPEADTPTHSGKIKALGSH